MDRNGSFVAEFIGLFACGVSALCFKEFPVGLRGGVYLRDVTDDGHVLTEVPALFR